MHTMADAAGANADKSAGRCFWMGEVTWLREKYRAMSATKQQERNTHGAAATYRRPLKRASAL